MKIIAALILLIAAISCNKESGEQNDNALYSQINITLTTDSRIAFEQNRYHWQGGESLGVYIASQSPTTNAVATIEVRDGLGYCTMQTEPYSAGDILYAYTPHSTASRNAEQVVLTIPSEQSVATAGEFPADAMPMVSDPYTLTESEDISLMMRPVGSILCYNIYATADYSGEKVLSVRYATSTPIAGSVEHNITDSALNLDAMGEYAVSTTLASSYAVPATLSAATPVYMVVAPGEYTGTLTITTDAAIYTYNHSQTAIRNNYYDINIDLSRATHRKSLTGSEPITATLTYAECKDVIAGYKAPNTYTNSHGQWTICAYNYNNEAIQINSGKVAYIGTPTFAGKITSISLTLVESYSNNLYICTEAGTTSASGVAKTISVSGKSVTADLSELNLSSLYIRSAACMRISAVTIVYGGSGGTVLPDPDPEPTPTPEPEPTPDPEPSTAKYVWAELPVIADSDNNGIDDSDSSLYYAHHLCAGGEKNAQSNGTARNYTVCYSSKHHCPLWVAAPRHAMYEKKNTDRTDAYGVDPKIPSSIQYNSKSTGGGCNKGHMLGSAERLCSAATNRQVFYYTNIAPQYSSTFNTGGGAWNNLEDHIDGLVCADTLYVVVGCYFDSFSRNGASATPKTISFGGRDDVSCPTMFYYALLRTKSGSSGKRVQECTAAELQCAAFTICHTMAKGHEPQAADMMSISELEALTGIKYFQNVPNAPKTTYSASDWL
ncbi:MAG: DNA/RNA non-specific endonuclease [Alistipes sp.]|nr:DNA/RNA non-specific endonuclease [Alistipes sp.]